MALLKTHPNFKSADPNIKDVNKIYDYMSEPLAYQDTFKREMIPNIIPNLNSFKINLEKVDRLYYLHYENDDNTEYSMVIRLVAHEGLPPLYVKLVACHDSNDSFDERGAWGILFISADVDLFMKVITECTLYNYESYERNPIYNFLQKEDGIRVEREFDKNDVKFQEAKKIYELLLE